MLAAILTHASDSSSSARSGRPDAEQVFKSLDSGDKGYLTVDDLQAAVVKISAAGAKRAEAAGKSAPSAQKLFDRLDSDGDGKLTQQEFEAAVPKGLRGGGPAGAGGAKPAGGQAPAGGAGASPSTDGSSDIKEPADTNEDGKVSAKEQAAYDAKLAAERAAAVKAYESVGQIGQDAAAA